MKEQKIDLKEMNKDNNQGKIVIYQTDDGDTKIDVRFVDETVWLTQAQLCKLYQTSKSNVSEHIKNIFEEGELEENSVVRKFRTAASDGKNYSVSCYEYFEIKIEKLKNNSNLWVQTIFYANNCPWNVGKHLAKLLEQDDFRDFEGVFIALSGNNIIGFCTFLETDYYPENRCFPWISSIFVDEEYRGNRISEKLIQSAINHARKFGFDKVYIPSNIIGLYEKYGFCKIDELENYDGDIDNIFMKEI